MTIVDFPNGYQLDNDPTRLDIDKIHGYLSNQSYWAQGRTREQVIQSIEHSFCFGLYAPQGDLVGFARVVTDWTTFAWLCDVFILDFARGLGLSKLMVQAIVQDERLRGVRRFMLATRDAHELYRNYGGFRTLTHPERWMERFQE
jgi:GNAT superfamily N-acetyltransferase